MLKMNYFLQLFFCVILCYFFVTLSLLSGTRIWFLYVGPNDVLTVQDDSLKLSSQRVTLLLLVRF